MKLEMRADGKVVLSLNPDYRLYRFRKIVTWAIELVPTQARKIDEWTQTELLGAAPQGSFDTPVPPTPLPGRMSAQTETLTPHETRAPTPCPSYETIYTRPATFGYRFSGGPTSRGTVATRRDSSLVEM